MIKFTRNTKKKLDKVRSSSGREPGSSSNRSHGGGGDYHGSGHAGGGGGGGRHGGDRSVSSAYSAYSGYSNYSEHTHETSGQYSHGGNNNNNGHAPSTSGRSSRSNYGGGGGNSRRYSSAQSVVSISTASVFSPSVAPGGGGGGGGEGGGMADLRPSSSRTLHDLNASRRSSLLTSIGTAASRTFRSYKMTLPRCPPPPKNWGNGSSSNDNDDTASALLDHHNQDANGDIALESDLELLGRTVHAVSSALTEPPKEGDKYMIYDVSFNPKGCVWDALIVVQLENEDEKDDDEDAKSRGSRGSRKSEKSSRSRSRSKSRSRRDNANGAGGDGSGNSNPNGWDMNQTFSFPIRVTCAEDDDYDDPPPPPKHGSRSSSSNNPTRGPHPFPNNVKRAKTYAVDLSVIDDAIHHPISRWSTAEAAEHREDIKNAMEWVSYGIRRSMARSMFPKFPDGCQDKPFREVYQLNKKLKSGTFSTVCRGVHRATGRQVAVKCILRKKIEPSVDAAVFEEVLIMSGLHHKYICPMIDYFEEDRCHFVVMELEKGGDLCERLNDKQTYSEADARTVVRNITEAMEFVHSKGFAHCDIKPRNYLLRSKRDDCDVRLADFGFAQHVHAPNSLTSQCGTPFFVAPEVINRKPYDYKVDMWSIGVTAYLLLCGETPFNGKNRQQLFRRISCDEPTFPDEKWGHISDEAVDFVRKLLSKDPAKRLSAAGALQHRWLADPNQSHSMKSFDKSNVSNQSSSSEITEGVTRRSRGDPPIEQASPTAAASYSNRIVPPSPSTSFHNARSNSSNNNVPPPAPSRQEQSRSPARKARQSSMRREKTPVRSSQPPPPPKPPAPVRDTSSSSISTPTSYTSHTPAPAAPPAVDENARLLDVIREQDEKIAALERMVKRMLEPEGTVHEC